jgi:pimeloyl-ACP methyl ester carboxylesterase
MRRAGAGEAVVLVHGYLGGSRQWAAEIDHLSTHFDVVAVDLAGYGEARDRVAPTDMAAHAHAVLATLGALGIDRFHLLGHSMGGMVAQQMVVEAPRRVDRLATVRQPTLVVWGERDRSYGWAQIEALWRGIPQASLAVLPNCAHALHLECPTLFRAVLADFLTAPARAAGR